MKKILVPFDGSDSSVKAAEEALKIAKAFDSEITFLTVVEDKTMLQYSVVGSAMNSDYLNMVGATVNAEKQHAEDRLDNLITSLGADDMKHEQLVVVGDITTKIIETAEEEQYDLIVMGHRGLNPLKRLIIGSIAKNIIEHGPCSVLIIKNASQKDTVNA